jgi:hypothetical protein
LEEKVSIDSIKTERTRPAQNGQHMAKLRKRIRPKRKPMLSARSLISRLRSRKVLLLKLSELELLLELHRMRRRMES